MALLKLKVFLKGWLRALGLNVSELTDSGLIASFLGKCFPVTTDVELIRIGENRDGGYLVPDDLDGITACFSPGVANTASFEMDLAKRGIQCYLADYSVESPPVESSYFHFEKKFLGTQENDVFTTLDNWVKRNARDDDRDLLLQMDIEGSEYDVLLETSAETLDRFRIMVIEFHELISLTDRFGYKYIDATFTRLLRTHAIVHIHPNNISKPIKTRGFVIPPIMEFTFLRRDRFAKSERTRRFPHRWDFPCIPGGRALHLPGCWYYHEL